MQSRTWNSIKMCFIENGDVRRRHCRCDFLTFMQFEDDFDYEYQTDSEHYTESYESSSSESVGDRRNRMPPQIIATLMIWRRLTKISKRI